MQINADNWLREAVFMRRLKERELPAGYYVSRADVLGEVITFAPYFPSPADDYKEVDDYAWILNHLGEFEQNTNSLCEKIAACPLAKYRLVENILLDNKGGYWYADHDTDTNQKLFALLRTCDLQVIHLIINPTYSIDELERIVKYWGTSILNTRLLNTALFLSIYSGSVNLNYFTGRLQFFLRNGADCNVMHTSNGTLLHIMLANEEHESLVKTLIDELEKLPIDRAFNYTQRDKEGKTPLLIAVKTRNISAARLLLDVHKKGKDIGLNIADSGGRTPLMIAAALGCGEILSMLLDANADEDAKDNFTRTVDSYVSCNTVVTQALLKSIHIEPDRAVTTNHSWLYFNDRDRRPLLYKNQKVLISTNEPYFSRMVEVLYVAERQDKDLFIYLCNQVVQCLGLDASKIRHIKQLKPNMVKTLIDVCEQGKQEVKEVIKKRREHKLRIACAMGNIDEVNKLLQKNTDPNAADELGRTALHYAVMRSDLVKTFLPPAHSDATLQASMKNHPAIVEILLGHGAQLDKGNSRGNTPQDLISRDIKSNNALDAEVALAIEKTLHVQRAALNK